MAARPPILQFLERGKLLCGSNFPVFVRTWNWLVDGFDTFLGDGDQNPQNGSIFVDRTNPARPLITWKAPQWMEMNSATYKHGRFAVDTFASGSIKLKDCFYRVGGKTYEFTGTQEISITSGYVALQVAANGSTPTASLTAYADIAALNQAEADLTKYTVPLYYVDNNEVKTDFRIGPDCAMGEF